MFYRLSKKEEIMKRSHNAMWHNAVMSLGLLALLWVMTGCQLTQSTYARTTNNAGSAFAAAATTLTYAHKGKISYAYAAASFVNFQSELSGIDQTLTAQKGANASTIKHLLALYTPAMQAVDAPCLTNTCDWQKQVDRLNRASQAFLEASNS